MSGAYSLEDITKSLRWLGHKGYTELNAYHPDYKPGKDNFEWNAKHNAFPRVWYARNQQDVTNFVNRYADGRIVCYGLNSRPKIFKTGKGYPRSAREVEIEASQSLLLDFDFENKELPKEQIAAFELFLEKAEDYFLDIGLNPPVRAFTGKGYHLLFAYPEIKVKEHLDISQRLREFRDRFESAYRQELGSLEAKLDSTQDLRRMVKIYGTAKPGGALSRFYGNERVEDEKLYEYLLAMTLPESDSGSPVVKAGKELPSWFHALLQADKRVKELWSGAGKPDGSDTTGSGYDYSLVKRLLNLGYRNIDDLATILVLRPQGSFQKGGKGENYIRRTIASALLG